MSTVPLRARYFEDLDPGEVFTTSARTVTEADVSAFAGLSGDFNPLHTDAAFASETQVGERIAHGLLGLSLASGLVSRLGFFEGTTVALMGIEGWSFHAPIRFGETVHVEGRVERKRRTRNPERGLVWRHMKLVARGGDVLQEGTFVLMVRTRPGEDTDA